MVSSVQEPSISSAIDRRGFLRSLGGGLLVLVATSDGALAQESGHQRRHESSDQIPQNLSAWLHISHDGAITAFTGKVEVGQNIRTSLTQAVADELNCAPGAVTLVMGDTDFTPWDMGTFGSRTTPTMAPQMRRMAAAARQKLISAAAAKLSVDPKTLRLKDGCVTDSATGKSFRFGELASAVNWTEVIPADSPTTPARDWHVAGESLAKVSAREFVTGKHRYTSDLKLEDMLHARVLRPPSFEATLVSVETGRAQQMPGVSVVRDGDFIAIAAPDERVAEAALEQIDAKWQQKPQISSADLFRYIKQRGSGHESQPSSVAGGDTNLNSSYNVAYIAHTPLEPRAAVAQWSDGKLTVWTGTQRPFGVRGELAEAFHLPENRVRVVVPDTGSAYGGKHSGECAIEAARVAKLVGKPVKLIWTRQEEFTWAYFRPAGLIEVRSSASKAGQLTSWEFQNFLSGPSGLDTPYKVTNPKVHYVEIESPLRVGSYRGLAATANHFARESHMDEIAASLAMNPLTFRLNNLENERLRAVLKAAAERFGWPTNYEKGRGIGLACGTEKGGYVACCVAIAVTGQDEIRVERVVEAWECGAVVNPEHLKNQVEGAIVMGLGGALFENIEFADGRILNASLAKYRVPRFLDVPVIESVILNRKDLPSAGAGETPVVAIAPAIANALYNATGLRVRSMPLLPGFRALRTKV